MAQTRSTCPYCGVGCGVLIETDGVQITGVQGDPDHPANFGRLCSKGSTLHLTATAHVTRHTRLLTPQRRADRGAPLQPIGWDAALDLAADRFAAIVQRDGPDAVGFYLSGQLLTEDYYVFNKLVKGLVGTNNIDTNSRLCMSSAVAGYKLTLGADAPPCSYEDLDHAQTVFIVGSNMAFAHPVLFRRLEDAKRARPGMKIIVADPRRTETAEFADLYLPLLPGSDVALFNSLLHVLLWEGLVDKPFIDAHTSGFAQARDRARDFPPKETAKLCGIAEADLVQAARWMAEGPTLSLYCQGLNQSSSGTAKNAALINLHLATGQIGKPGAGPFSLTGQPNAMGGREVGGMATLLSGHRDLANPAHRAEVAALWGVPSVPTRPGKSAVEMFEAAADGSIKALWIACTNPAQSMPDQATVRRALERAEFVVVQEAFSTTATCRYADLLLPATTWGEKDGTVTNSERRISRVRRAVAAPGQARDDWSIAVELARRLETRLRDPGAPTLFPYTGPEAIWNEHRESTRGRDLDITGLDYVALEAAPAQWPWPEGAATGRTRLYGDGIFPTPDGRARFADVGHAPLAEPRDARYPFSLNTGRLRDQWHGMSRTGTLGRLFGHVPEPGIEMHGSDMARLHLASGDLVRVSSRRGTALLPVAESAESPPTQVFIPMHWGDEFLGGYNPGGLHAGGVNALTCSAFDPLSLQPELKHAAVKIEKAALPWRLVAMAWLDADRAFEAREELQALMDRFAFAACVPFGRERTGVLFRAADAVAPPLESLMQIEAIMGLNGPKVLHYQDERRGQRRSVRLEGEGAGLRIAALLLGGDTSAEAWMKPLMQDDLPAQPYGRLLLLPGAAPPVPVVGRGQQVCSCIDVSATQIESALVSLDGNPDERLAKLQAELRCGTQCGSCVPALKKFVRVVQPLAA
ncbi:MAG: molybdopterin-dependent oxidoreductase [Pseudomonadota bacterium]|nr:molybdopterin-dependent oxidoreductase [Pseudomonadota bacterium]